MSSATNFGSTAASLTGSPVGAGLSWTNPSDALTDNAAYATAGPASLDDISEYLKVTNFGFVGSIPAGSTVDGIVAEFKRKTDTASLPIDYSIRIVKGGTIQGDEKSAGAGWSTTEAYVSFGTGTTDKWGLTWNLSDVTASDFGVVISVQDPSVSGWTASINAVRITVYYTPAATARTLALLGVGS